jgi:hypothetical protein
VDASRQSELTNRRHPWQHAGQRISIRTCNALNSACAVNRLGGSSRHTAIAACATERSSWRAAAAACPPAARAHAGRLPERASLRSSRSVTRTSRRDPAAGAPSGSAAADAGTRTVAVSGAAQMSPHLRPATYRPGGGPNSEHTAAYPGAPTRLVLLLLHDFPDPGRFHRFACSSPPSDTLKPHERPFTGMFDRHPRSASGRGGCSVSFWLGVPPLPGSGVGVSGPCRW